jgi:hypothetical protein
LKKPPETRHRREWFLRSGSSGCLLVVISTIQ